MPDWAQVIGSAAVGAFAGVIAVSLLAVLFCVLFAREAFWDGQFTLLFFFTVPFGAAVGGVAGAALALSRFDQSGIAGWLCVIAGALLAVLTWLLSWASAATRQGGLAETLLGPVHPGAGAPLLWAAGLIVWGFWLLRL